jgi:hypothetical protein
MHGRLLALSFVWRGVHAPVRNRGRIRCGVRCRRVGILHSVQEDDDCTGALGLTMRGQTARDWGRDFRVRFVILTSRAHGVLTTRVESFF